ncbi:hypothetical protein [Curtobacterium sp. 458]|uniref:hypothetical protein n=1 Tax=Curtobacterium sp. 458 TaxID=3050069 RepID=UPI0025B54228|nr:hypothetical protein [Curtobacterium sp. 458]WJX99922.1 hypothetical protein QPJ90_16730 [Curtobacterium sp. 458]
MSDDFTYEDELAAGREIWKLVSTILGMPEGTEDAREYWPEAMQGTGLLLGMLYKLANELNEHHNECDATMPATTRHLIQQVLAHEDLIRDTWQSALH